jgi:hypothetical protein
MAKTLEERILDADTRCNKWLADGNEAIEAENPERAARCYDKAQFWLDRRTSLEAKRDALALKTALVIRFDQTGDFAAINAARQWCRQNGVSFGPLDRFDVVGLMVGDYAISKWHNMTEKEKKACDGTITGDFRNGPLTLRISRAALAARPSKIKEPT